jgi:hypothetical protein
MQLLLWKDACLLSRYLAKVEDERKNDRKRENQGKKRKKEKRRSCVKSLFKSME